MIEEKELKRIFDGYGIRKAVMSRLTTFGTGGQTLLIDTHSAEQTVKVIRLCQYNAVPYKVLGNGSNCIAPDEGYEGIIVRLRGQNISVKGNILTADGGVSGASLADYAAERDLGGAEFLACIPTTVGGAVARNCGCYGADTQKIFVSALLTDGKSVVRLLPEQLDFAYHHSRLSESGLTLLQADFRLFARDRSDIRRNIRQLRERKRREQPLGCKSAGSVFARGEGEVPALLIDRAGLKGVSIGGACVSTMHAGFIVNAGNATTNDLVRLIDFIKQKIYNEKSTVLQTEIEFLPKR